MLRKRSFFWKVVTWTSITLAIFVLGLYKLIVSSNDPMAITKNFIYIEPLNSFFRRTDVSHSAKKDWNDYQLLSNDLVRIGFGEHGLKTFTDRHDADNGRCSVSNRRGKHSASSRHMPSSMDISISGAIGRRRGPTGKPVQEPSKSGTRRRTPASRHNLFVLHASSINATMTD